jgi:LPS-assembly protein
MTSALAALLVLGQAGLPVAVPRADEPIQVRADRAQSDSDGDTIILEGHAELRTSGTMVQGETITLDQQKNTVTATGRAFCASGFLGAVADQLTLELDTGTVIMMQGTFFEKKRVGVERLLAAKSPSELESLGQTTVSGTADRIQRGAGGHLLIQGLTFTPCDCDPLKPHWSIASTSADVVPGEGAWLWLPVIRVYGTPVFALPVMYVPLSDRKTGLLPILPSYSAQNGWSIPIPVYVTLGRSADIEFDLGYTFGGSNPGVGIQGPTLNTTFRFTPSLDTRGTAELFLSYDLNPPRNPENGGVWAGEEALHTGTRWGLTSQVVSGLGSGWTTRLDLNITSDAALTRDVATDVQVQANQYLSSTFQVAHRSEDSWVGLLLSYRQDTQFGYTLFGTDYAPGKTGGPDPSPGIPPGSALRGPATLQQLPEITVAFPEHPLWGPLWGSLDLTYTRLSPVSKLYGDEGQDGLFLPVGPANAAPVGVVDPLQGDGIYQSASERQARDRLDVVPRLVMTLPVSDVLRIRPSAWLRQDLYIGEMTGAIAQRGYAMVDLLVSSEMSRTFGEGEGALRHAIQPSVELRDMVGAWGNVPGPQPGRLYDAIDWAADTQRRLQGVAKLTQVLTRRVGVQAQELFRLVLAQEFDFSTPNGLADSVVSARTTLGMFSASANFRWDTQRHAPALFSLGAGVAHPKYFVRAQYDFAYLSQVYQLQNGIPQSDHDEQWVGGSAAQRRGIDALVGSPLPSSALDGSLLHLITLSAQVNLPFGLSLAYAGTLYPGAPPNPVGTPSSVGTHPFLGQQQITMMFAPACNCWRLDVGVRTPPGGLAGFPQIIIAFTIAGFGTFGN